MSAFARYETAPTKAPGTVVVPARAWSPTWEGRPDGEVVAGLRPLSESDILFCRTEALRLVTGWYPDSTVVDTGAEYDRTLAFNDALMRLAVSRGTCDPNDVTMPWEVWGKHGGDEIAREALTVEGTKLLWDALERITIETSPIEPRATDEDIQELLTKAPGALAAMPTWRAARTRRLLHFCFNEVLGARGDVTDG